MKHNLGNLLRLGRSRSIRVATPSSSPDIETSSPSYASRFSGRAGAYLLSVQTKCVRDLIAPYTGGTLLEIGGGHGQLVDLYEQLHFAYAIQGSDETCFDFNVHSLPPEKRIICNMRELPFEDSSVDLVVAIRLFAHLEDWEDVLREMCRVARKSVLIDFPAIRSLNGLSPMLFGLKKRIEGNTRSYSSFSIREIRTPLENGEFKVDRIIRQFFLPMFVHRVLKGHELAQGAEWMMRAIGITALLGSPAVLRATRIVSDVPAINSLYGSCSNIEAHRGEKLTEQQADELIAGANGIISSLDENASLCQ